MKKKRIILAALLIALISGGWYGYSEYTRKVKDLVNVRADFRKQADELLTAFEQDEAGSNARFLDKVITVTGPLKSVEKNEQGFYTVVLGEEGSLSAVRCSMDPAHQGAASGWKAGQTVSVKGACTGFNPDELLGSDVILNRCVPLE